MSNLCKILAVYNLIAFIYYYYSTLTTHGGHELLHCRFLAYSHFNASNIISC